MIRDQFWQAVQIIAMCAAVAIALIWVCSCGRVPTVDEFLKGKRIQCDVKIEVPESRRLGNTVDISGVELSNCREKTK